jgi:hypothetical protein
MIVSINQPAYLPWLGYFARIAASDLHIVLDHVQFEKNSMVNRNKIRTKDGWSWLTVPIQTKGRFGQLPIQSMEVDNLQPWERKHLNALRTNYARASHFAAHEPFFTAVYSEQWQQFAPLARKITDYMLKTLEIRTPLLFSSDMNITRGKSELVLDLCRAACATVYLSGPFGRDYLDEAAFCEAGIEVRYHDFHHPSYRQVFDGFEPYMSAIDLLFNYGPESRNVIFSK